MPESIDTHIDNIQVKLNALIKNYQAVMVENRRLKNDVEKLKSSHDTLKVSVAGLEQQNNILKASAGKMVGEEKQAFEKVINQYIKAIDKCMAMLNS